MIRITDLEKSLLHQTLTAMCLLQSMKFMFSLSLKKKILIIRIMIVIWVKGYMIRIAPWDKKGKRRAKGLYKIDNPRVVIL